MMLPLTQWRLSAGALPDDLAADQPAREFALPGAEELGAFADLFGSPAEDGGAAECAQKSACFSLPAMLPEGVSGRAELSREIDFGALAGDFAVLILDQLAGCGCVLLDGDELLRFDSRQPAAAGIAAAAEQTGTPCMHACDLSGALHLGRKQTLTIRFDDVRPAGVPGPVFLSTPADARLTRVTIAPGARQSEAALEASVCAARAGDYVLRAYPCAARAGEYPAREIRFSLATGETRSIRLAFDMPQGAFVPGKAYDPPVLKILLTSLPGKRGGRLCDEALLAYGGRGRLPGTFVPLTDADCACTPQELAARLAALHIASVSLPAPAPNGFYRALLRQGVAVTQYIPEPLRAQFARYPHLRMADSPFCHDPVSHEASAWQMGSPVAFARAADPVLTPDEMLEEAAGFLPDRNDPAVRDTLARLRAQLIRMRAEAARQERLNGAVCAPGEAFLPAVSDALRAAFAPVHLSALPLLGAWWTDMLFSASIAVYLPAGEMPGRPLHAAAVLEDGEGVQLARFDADCTFSGYAGVIEVRLPGRPSVLTLRTILSLDGEILEECALPVYAGARGPLEAAFPRAPAAQHPDPPPEC